MHVSYCLKCKKKTSSRNAEKRTSKNGRRYVVSRCMVCGSKKSQWVSSSASEGRPARTKKGQYGRPGPSGASGNGLIGNLLGLPNGKVPVLGDIPIVGNIF